MEEEVQKKKEDTKNQRMMKIAVVCGLHPIFF